MGDLATLVYDVPVVSTTVATMQPKVEGSGVFISPVLAKLGARLVSDLTGALNPIVRTVVYTFSPAVAAVAIPLLTNEGRFRGATVTVAGFDYILPPLVKAIPAAPASGERGSGAIFKSFLNVQGVTVTSGGVAFVAPVVTFLGGLPPAGNAFFADREVTPAGYPITDGKLPVANPILGPPAPLGCVNRVNLVNGGRGYPVGTIVTIQGGGPNGSTPLIPAKATLVLNATGRVTRVDVVDMGAGYVSVPKMIFTPPAGFSPPANFRPAKAFPIMAQGTPARATATVVLGVITAITVTDPGDGYVSVPRVLIRDAAGSGASAKAGMGLGRVDVVNPGRGYVPGTILSITPAFKSYFPDASNQGAPFSRLYEAAIGQGALTPVISAPVVIT